LVEVVDKEKNLRDKLVTELDNVSRKELETKQKAAKAALSTQIDRTSSSESQLQTTTKRLTAARNKLISSYEKLAELEQFFALAIRDVKGIKTTKGDIEDLINSARASGSTDLAKQAASEAQAGLSAGTINKSDALSLVEQARAAAIDIQNETIARNTQQVQYLEQTQANLAEAVNKNIQSQYNLQQSLDALNQQIASLAGDIGGSVPNEAEAPKSAPVPQADTSVEDVPLEGFAKGGLITGTSTGDTIPILSTAGEFVQPTRAVQAYGSDFMKKIQTLQIDPGLIKALTSVGSLNLASTSNRDVSQLQPVLFNIGGDTIHTKAAPDAVAQFQSALRIQALKSGRRLG
jgi:cell division septum initiation protein DivIVA